MRDLIPFLKLYKKHWFGLSLGMLLAFLTLFASIGLLTLSGWFLSAAAIAGLTIARETFNYMLPGAFVRGFAMGRTAGRWGERVVSHNATFKLLTDLRIFFFLNSPHSFLDEFLTCAMQISSTAWLPTLTPWTTSTCG